MLRITRYQQSRYWALWDGNDLVAVVPYKKGATELLRRLAAQPQQAQAAAQAVRARVQPACEAGAVGG